MRTTPRAKRNLEDGTIKPWKPLSSKMALDEKWFPVRKHRVELPSGTIIDDFFVWESPNIAVAIPITSEGKFVICEQYRFGAGKVIFQFPAGMINKNEEPEAAAIREMEEESGYIGGHITYLGKVTPFGSKMTGWHHMFLIKGVNPGGTKDDDENEPTKIHLKTARELVEMIENGEFESADCLAGALWTLRKLGL